jgi:hypothetical protein
VLSAAEVARWWRARAEAVGRLHWTVEGDVVRVRLDDPPRGAALALFQPNAGWAVEPLGEEASA